MSSIRQSVKTLVMKRQGGLCAGVKADGEVCGIDLVALKTAKYMHKYLPKGFTAYQADHIIPDAQGGPDEAENVQMLCGWCHHAKTAIERPDWKAPSPSIFKEVLVSSGRKGINGPMAEARPSKTMRLISKRPAMKCG